MKLWGAGQDMTVCDGTMSTEREKKIKCLRIKRQH